MSKLSESQLRSYSDYAMKIRTLWSSIFFLSRGVIILIQLVNEIYNNIMIIRSAEQADQEQIIDLYKRSQVATGLPDQSVISPSELGSHLYSREAIYRYVATDLGRIIAHGLVEPANPNHINSWRLRLDKNDDREMIEMGGAFVDPMHANRGIWTQLLKFRLSVIRDMESIPVSATWSQNRHVIKTFMANGGKPVGQQRTSAGFVDLFVFKLR